MDIIIKQNLFISSLFLLWTAGLIAGSDVTQTDILWKHEGNNATINCSHKKGALYFHMYWYRQLPGETMKQIVFTTANNKPDFEPDFRDERFSTTKPDAESGTFTVKNLVPGDKGLYFCAVKGHRYNYPAYFGQGTKLTVLEDDRKPEPPTVKVLPPSLNECRNKKDSERKKTLVCVASKFYPDHVSVFWQIDGEDVTEGVATDDAALRPKGERNYTITSRLRVSAESWFTPTRKFKCVVKFYNGNDYKTYEDSINGVEAPAKGNAITREKYLRVTQTAKLSYAVFIVKSSIYGAFVAFLVWKLQGKQNN